MLSFFSDRLRRSLEPAFFSGEHAPNEMFELFDAFNKQGISAVHREENDIGNQETETGVYD